MNYRFKGSCLASFVFACAAGTPVHAQLRELTTDRPDQTESPITVDKGRFQIEVDVVNFTRDRDRSGGGDIRSESVGVAPINLKYGLTDSSDIQFVFDSYQHTKTVDRIAARVLDKRSGAGDLTIRYKYNIFGNDGGNALGVMPFVKIPTNSNGIGNKRIEGGVIVPYAIELPVGGIGLMTELDLVRNSADDGYSTTFVNSATYGFDVSELLGMYVEFVAAKNSESGSPWELQGDVGFTIAVSDQAALDFGVNVGLNAAAPDINPFLGFSVKF